MVNPNVVSLVEGRTVNFEEARKIWLLKVKDLFAVICEGIYHGMLCRLSDASFCREVWPANPKHLTRYDSQSAKSRAEHQMGHTKSVLCYSNYIRLS